MSDETTEILTTIDDYLLSLADGISLAQQELSRSAAVGKPGQQYHYYMPKVDFELRMKVNVVQDETLSERYRSVRPDTARDTHLLFAPAKAGSTNTTTTTEVISVVKGSFVAVPSNDGLPSVLLRTEVTSGAGGKPQVEVWATNAAGEPISGLEVQFNLDREETAELSGVTDPTTALANGTALGDAVVYTDSTGRAATVLILGSGQKGKASRLAVVIDAASRTELIVYEVQ